ncbi:hypothetical protein [Natronospora cellulosivora (SeqCode)]
MGVWGKGYGGKPVIVEGIRTDDRTLTGFLEDLLVIEGIKNKAASESGRKAT